MSELVFGRRHAKKAISLVEAKGLPWLLENYSAPNAGYRTGFLTYKGKDYPLKPLGRLANELAGSPLAHDLHTISFRAYFKGLGFQLKVFKKLVFGRRHAKKAISLVEAKGLPWLLENYSLRKSRTGFLTYKGKDYPLKPLGRLANELAGSPLTNNPNTNRFRTHFKSLGFQLTEGPEKEEAEQFVERQRRRAEVWNRPGQDEFRTAVFNRFDKKCLISGCTTLAALQAAHIVPVSCGGDDQPGNGIPLRADLHLLFDAGAITIDAKSLKVKVAKYVREDYGMYHGVDLSKNIRSLEFRTDLEKSLKKRKP